MNDQRQSSEFNEPFESMELDEAQTDAEKQRIITIKEIWSVENYMGRVQDRYGLIIELKNLLRSFNVFIDTSISQVCSLFNGGCSKALHCQPSPLGIDQIIKLFDPAGNQVWFEMVRNQLTWAINHRVASLMDKSRPDLVKLLTTVENCIDLWSTIDMNRIKTKLQTMEKKEREIVMAYMGTRKSDQRILLKGFVLVLDESLESTATEWDKICQLTEGFTETRSDIQERLRVSFAINPNSMDISDTRYAVQSVYIEAIKAASAQYGSYRRKFTDLLKTNERYFQFLRTAPSIQKLEATCCIPENLPSLKTYIMELPSLRMVEESNIGKGGSDEDNGQKDKSDSRSKLPKENPEGESGLE